MTQILKSIPKTSDKVTTLEKEAIRKENTFPSGVRLVEKRKDVLLNK